jgi:hypothetical protein
MPNHPGTTQRLLDLYLRLPVSAPDALLERELATHSPGLSDRSRGVRLSEMRLCTNRTVRANLATIAAWAAQRAQPSSARYTHAFLAAARAIRDGRPLP